MVADLFGFAPEAHVGEQPPRPSLKSKLALERWRVLELKRGLALALRHFNREQLHEFSAAFDALSAADPLPSPLALELAADRLGDD